MGEKAECEEALYLMSHSDLTLMVNYNNLKIKQQRLKVQSSEAKLEETLNRKL